MLFNDAGTEYSNHDQILGCKTEQAMGQNKRFVCIVRASNGGTRPNTTWKALIDEISYANWPTRCRRWYGAVSYAEATSGIHKSK
ncbi:MAG: hypothetical protein CM15mP81_10890 [Alphaproteobacteria bacterium]|nr:MAG: hypothetical protein CM15mP81_10890 [Alphaproteobacteria bacterium]